MVYCGEEAVESFQKVVERRGSGGGERTVLSFRTMSAPAIKPMILTRLGKPFSDPDWIFAVSGQGHINLSVKVRPRPKDSGLVAREVSWRESKTMEPSDNMLRKEYAQLTRLQRTVNANVAS